MKVHSHTHKCACLLGVSGGILPPPWKIWNLDPLRLLVTQSGTRLLFNTCENNNHTQFKDFWVREGRGEFQPLPPSPLYKTLLCLQHLATHVHIYCHDQYCTNTVHVAWWRFCMPSCDNMTWEEGDSDVS